MPLKRLRGILFIGKMGMEALHLILNGLYNVSDAYFDEFKVYASSKNGSFCDNKKEKRPYCYALKEKNRIIWLIPLSRQADKYEDKISEDEKRYKECIFYHIGMIGKVENAFLIGDMFPVTQKLEKSRTVQNVNAQKFRLSGEAFCGLPIHGG